MHLPQYKLCTRKTVLALEVKFYLDVHWISMATVTNADQLNDVKYAFSADQRKWRQIRISAVSGQSGTHFCFSQQDKHIIRVAVGIGKGIKPDELERIAGTADRMITAPDFDELKKEIDRIIKKIQDLSCGNLNGCDIGNVRCFSANRLNCFYSTHCSSDPR